MPRGTHEQTINTALGEILEERGRGWVVDSELIGRTFEDDGSRPDILIMKPEGWPIVIEAEVMDHHQAELDARSRLGKRLATCAATVDTAVALVYPSELREYSGEALRAALRNVAFEYALVSAGTGGDVTRFPASGWLSGGLVNLALFVHRASLPAWRVETLAGALEDGVTRAEGTLTAAHRVGSAVGLRIAAVLGQSDDHERQTRKMAMTVIVNALVFQAALAEAGMPVTDQSANGPRPVMSPPEFRSGGNYLPTPLRDEWDRILRVNYWPIFHSAGAILAALPTRTAVAVLNALWETAENLIAGGVTRSHDLTGVVFQRLIADRKFLATFYTRPAAAALLAGLALPVARPLRGVGWSDAESLGRVRIGDFACGTGTLLATAYHRMSLLHEVHGGDSRALHPTMMKRGLVGLDVLNVAVHLTATMLASSFPDTPFDGECLLTMPYGRHEYGACLGSLDLLSDQPGFDIMQAAAHTAGGRGEDQVRELLGRVGHGQFDLVIMNPPFVRHGAREGDRSQVHNPAFAAFEATEEDQDALAAHLKQLATGGCAHGHAGMASYFVELARRKLAPSGTLALVLPLTAMSGSSWEEARRFLTSECNSLVVVSITERGSFSRSFSADTGMAECLVVGQKSGEAATRATFVVLSGQPRTALEGELIAEAVNSALDTDSVRQLEDGPFGGTRISIGTTQVGQLIGCPLPAEGSWQTVGINDLTLAQSAYQLTAGRLWIEGMREESPVHIPVARIRDVARRIGPHDLDITGAQIKADGLPQGPFEKIDGVSPGAAYPCLWNHDSARERCLHVLPDSHCQIRQVRGVVPLRLRERAALRWDSASRSHYNRDCQFNSQSTIVVLTPEPTIGGRAWPTVLFDNDDCLYAFALWCNSTLGLLCHWWMSNKSQAGRGTTTPTGIPLFHTLDLRRLSVTQHETARHAFADLAAERFMPFDQIDEDPSRAELDRRLLVDVLGLAPALCGAGGPMELLRRKLAAEPQIHDNKQTRLVFTADGERNERR